MVCFRLFQSWEMLVLSRLRWDLCAVTPHDFLEQILSRLPLSGDEPQLLKKHAQTFISLSIATSEYCTAHAQWRTRLITPSLIYSLALPPFIPPYRND